MMQVEALKKDRCHPIFVEKVSAVSTKRHQWLLCRKYLQRGDTLVVWSMSRIGRDIDHLLKIEKEMFADGVKIHSLTEPTLDTSTANGRLMFTVKAAFDQFEREITIERTRAGLRARQDAGHRLGREREMTDEKLQSIVRDLKKPQHTVKTVADKHGVSVATIYHYLPGGKSAALKR